MNSLAARIPARSYIAIAGIFAAGECHAMAPVYFDLERLLLYVALFLLGLIVLLVTIVFSRRRLMWCGVLLIYVAAPVPLIMISEALHDWSWARRIERAKRGDAINLAALAESCKNRQRVVHYRVPGAANGTLQVRLEKGFFGDKSQFAARSIRLSIGKHPTACEKTGLGNLEAIIDEFDRAGKRIDRSVETYEVCKNGGITRTKESNARFYMVFGEIADRKPAPWSDGRQNSITAYSVRVMDMQTGTLLASDTLYSLYPFHADGACPAPEEQIPALIADVFPQ